MAVSLRFVLTFLVFISVFYFTYWMPFSLILMPFGTVGVVIANLLSLLCAIAAARFTWHKTETARTGWGVSALKSAIIAGAIGFAGGFFGPLIFSPQSNQGPLLGIFLTGPLGFIFGGVLGFVRWQRAQKDVE